MPEMSSWPTQNSGPAGTIDSREAATHIGALVYPHTSALKAKSGFRPGPASPGLVTATGTPDANVHVAPFQLMLQNIRGSGLGTYIACLDAIKDINILSTPADSTNPRDDLIIAQQSDIFDADANSDFVVRQVPGTPASVPSDPAVTGSTNYVTLARVRVVANATTITSGNITDLRTAGHAKSLTGGLYSVALGGILPVGSTAQRDALTGLYSGLAVWRSDLKYLEVTDTSVWRPQGLVKIDEQILTGTASSITFNVPNTFRNLHMEIMCRGDAAAQQFIAVRARFNGDSGNNYDNVQLFGSSAGSGAGEVQNENGILLGDMPGPATVAGSAAVMTMDVPWYNNTISWKLVSTNKVLSSQTSGGQAGQLWRKDWAGRWRNTAAVTSVVVVAMSGNFITGTSAAIYGLP